MGVVTKLDLSLDTFCCFFLMNFFLKNEPSSEKENDNFEWRRRRRRHRRRRRRRRRRHRRRRRRNTLATCSSLRNAMTPNIKNVVLHITWLGCWERPRLARVNPIDRS